MTTKFWIRILAAIFAVSLWLGVVLLMPGEAAEAVNIYADGKLVKTVSLRWTRNLQWSARMAPM